MPEENIPKYNICNLQVTSASVIPKCNDTDIILGRTRLCQNLGCCEIVLIKCNYEEDRAW